ncbi:MAG: NrdJb, partial [Gammaproteobacteria bacterium]|nr:NrdJb [Gammaproteobacteria bacterium]
MTIKIDKKITEYYVVKESAKADTTAQPADGDKLDNVVQMHEKLERPPILQGSTYKIKTPLSEHALYVTINDIILNPDTE